METQEKFERGNFLASAINKSICGMLKYFRFLRLHLTIFCLTSEPSTLQPINPASISIDPVPQNGSKSVTPGFALARLIIHRANFGDNAEG